MPPGLHIFDVENLYEKTLKYITPIDHSFVRISYRRDIVYTHFLLEMTTLATFYRKHQSKDIIFALFYCGKGDFSWRAISTPPIYYYIQLRHAQIPRKLIFEGNHHEL